MTPANPSRRRAAPPPAGAPNFVNRSLFQIDNLDIMRGINSATIDLIATDPPFNKGRDFHATPDSLAEGASFQDRWRWEEDVQPEWLDLIQDDWPSTWFYIDAVRAFDEPMAAYLCYMGVRLMEMKRLLKPTGSVYLHCDPTASHYLKGVMDTIFGRKNFRNEIVWAYTGPGSPKMRQFNRKHDVIFWYSKGREWTFNANAVRVPYKDPQQRPRRVYDTGGAFDSDAIEALRERGKVPETWWTEFPIVARYKSVKDGGQRTGYPTQKPLALYERIILASSNPGDVVFDPFAGCATTCVAAERLGRQWIGADYWLAVMDIVVQRLTDAVPVPLQVEGWREAITRLEEPPVRTDAADIAAPALKTLYTKPYEKPLFTRDEMMQKLGEAFGWQCWGCDFKMVSSDLHSLGSFFHLHHRIPDSEGGSNELWNRCLLCPPCNNEIGNVGNLTALRRKAGYRKGGKVHPIDLVKATRWAEAETHKRREERMVGRTLPMRVEE